VQIKCKDNRIYAGDLQESVHVLKFRPDLGQLYIFADDVLNRWLTSFCLLDDDTIAGVDKFENFFVNRLPLGCEEDAEDDPAASKAHWENGFLSGAKYKMDKINQFFVGEVGTCVQKAQLGSASGEVIMFGTSMGALCCMVPLDTRQDIDLFVHLQMYMQVETQPLSGREHQSFRSSIEPLKDVIDGDLCEEFN